MPRARVFVTRHLPGGALDYLREHCETAVWQNEMPPPYEELKREASFSDGLLTLLTDRIDQPLLSSAPRLRAVSNMATGYDNIDVAAATRYGVLVTRTPGVLAETTADFAFALLLAVARRVAEADRYVRAGKWRTWGPEIMLGHDVHGATLGIVGMGDIGAEVAKRARGFDMRIVYHSRTAKPDLDKQHGMKALALEALLRESDFVTLHAPLTQETRGMIGEAQLRMMKPTAFLINTARGLLIDQPALVRALEEGWIAGAGLDVSDPEPIAPDDPLLRLDNLVIAPHIASASIATRSRMAMLAAEQLVQALEEKIPEHVVNQEVTTQQHKLLKGGQDS
jgi:glyoxylate reductase